MATVQAYINGLYTVLYGRTADSTGYNYWIKDQGLTATTAATATATLAQEQSLATKFVSTQQTYFNATYGGLTDAQFILALYNNLGGNTSGVSGADLSYWQGKLAAVGGDRAKLAGEFTAAFLDYNGTDPAGLERQAAFLNKVAVSEAWVAESAKPGNEFMNAKVPGDAAFVAQTNVILGLTSSSASLAVALNQVIQASVTDSLAGVVGQPGTVNQGQTFTLTTSVNDIHGTTANDTIIAAPEGSILGFSASTLTAGDFIDGDAGVDTLKIFNDGIANTALPANITVKNVENIEIYNSNAAFTTDGVVIDASKFAGATAINQIGVNAANVTNLAATTTAGFNGTTQAAINVTAAAAAASAAVALTNVAETTTLTVNAAAGGVLNSVAISGTRVDSDANGKIAPLNLTVTAGKDVSSLSVNSSVNAILTVGNEAGSAVALSTVDASASTGDLDLDTVQLAATVANVKTGAGADKVDLNTSLNATLKTASISSGAGKDVIDVDVVVGTAASGQAVTVDAGAGDDTINLNIAAGVGYNVQAGAGNDTVVITGTVKTTDVINGGDGTDTVSLASKANFVADDYIVFNKVLTNFETLKLTGVAALDLDAAQLSSNYTKIDLSTGSFVDNVGTQALVANGNLTAEAAGFIKIGEGTPAATAVTYAGSLNITEKATGTITAGAQSVALTVDAAKADVTATLAGDVKTASVTLVEAVNDKGTTVTTDDALFASKVIVDTTGGNLANLTSLTLSGNGTAQVTNLDGAKLVTIDASALNSVDIAGKAVAGLSYLTINTAAETIKLGAGIDTVTFDTAGASTYGTTTAHQIDTITGLNFVLKSDGTLDTAKSDDISITGETTFKKFTTAQTDLDLALKDAAASATGDNLVFQLGGDTYVFADNGNAGLLETTDTVIKVTGLVNLDALIQSLG